jgi:phosphoribosylaminoimidazole carboxylase PurE protein
MSRVVVLMGSPGDMRVAEKVRAEAESYGLDVDVRIGSAHKVPEHVIAMLRAYEADGVPTVYVTLAGRSNALSAFADALVASPVIACPPLDDPFSPDVWSSLRLPSGVASMVVMDPANAALAAAKILGLQDPAVRDAVGQRQKANADVLLAADREAKP